MDIVYSSLTRRSAAGPDPAAEVTEVVDTLWAHAVPGDGLEHAGGRTEQDRIDLLLFLRTPHGPDPDDAQRRAAALLHRSHLASPLLNRRYLPPAPLPDPPHTHDVRPTGHH